MYIWFAHSATVCCWTVDRTVHCQIYLHVYTDDTYY